MKRQVECNVSTLGLFLHLVLSLPKGFKLNYPSQAALPEQKKITTVDFVDSCEQNTSLTTELVSRGRRLKEYAERNSPEKFKIIQAQQPLRNGHSIILFLDLLHQFEQEDQEPKQPIQQQCG